MGEFIRSWPLRYIFTFSVSFIISVALFPLAIYLLKKFNVMDVPNERKVHKTPVPRMGGIVIYIAFVVPMISLWHFDHPQEGIIFGAGIALIIGAIDDIWDIPAVIKLIALFLMTLLIWRFGVITKMPFHLLGINLNIGGCDIPNLIITLLWLVGMTSAINALDHMDGLAGGVAVIAATSYFLVSLQTAQQFWALMSVALIGSLLGFLIFNRNPAKIFMGDSGSFFLGFSLGAIGIMGGWSTNPFKAAIVPFAVLSVPVMDLIYVIISRRFNGTTKSIRESIAYCGKDHIGHRICNLGFKQKYSVWIVYLIASTIAISALVIRQTENLESFLLLIQIVMVYIIIVVVMSKNSLTRKRSDK